MARHRLLVVDDDEDICANLSEILADVGYTVDVAYRADKALELMKHHAYRLALLDYRLPGTNGVELFRRMRVDHDGLHAFLVTAFASPETTASAMDAGFRQVLDKPVDMPTLLPLIDDACS
jgi:DNA-binding NtrC family response regulator